jgi:CelD/BcsL family acetyltransferase involved in cellulose biosynthesis
LRIAIHREIPEDARLRGQWNALVEEMESPEVFYTYEWALAVQRAYRSTMVPLLVLLYDDDFLVGVASLATSADQGQAFFLANTTADYCDFISHPTNRQRLVDAVFSELARLKIPSLILANFPADSASRAALPDISRGYRYSMFSRPAYQCARIVLGSPEQRLVLRQSVVNRKALRYALKGLGKQGPLRFEHLKSWETIEPVLPDFMQAHIARFVAMGRVSNIAYPDRQVFLAELAKALSSMGWMALTRLSVGDRAVGWNYGFRFAGSWFYYQPTFDTALQQYSPGVCLLSKMVEEACDDATIDVIDLGLGAEGYKERFATGVRETLHITMATSAAICLKAKMRYQAATMVKSVPRLENWIRSLLRQASLF